MTENLNVLDFLRAIFAFLISILILESRSFAVFWIALLLGTLLYGTLHTKKFSIKPGYKYLRQFLMDIILAILSSSIFLGYSIDVEFDSLITIIIVILTFLLITIWVVRVLKSKDWDRILIEFSSLGGTYEIFSLKKRHWIRMLVIVIYAVAFVITESRLLMISGLWGISSLNQWISEGKVTLFPQSRYFLHTLFDIFIYLLIFGLVDDFPVDTLPFIITVSIVAAVFMQKAREAIWEP